MGDLRDAFKKAGLIDDKTDRRLKHEERVQRKELGHEGLVPRRVDRVQSQELLQQPDCFVLEAHCSACESAVSSLRTRQSSGKKTTWTRRPSTSTGVPWVPTTESPITRVTTL